MTHYPLAASSASHDANDSPTQLGWNRLKFAISNFSNYSRISATE